MGKVELTKTELVWPGKYHEDGTLALPPTSRRPLVLRERYSSEQNSSFGPEDWRNQLIWGDNLPVMEALLKDFAEAIDLIYIDPPFATGNDFYLASQEKAYQDNWGRDLSAYLSMLWPRLMLMRELLSDSGSMYVHIGWEVGAQVQLLLNEVFGERCLQNVIVYNYGKFHHSKERWKRDFDMILFYSKNPQAWTFNHEAVLDAYRERTEVRFDKVDEEGRRYKIVKGRRVYRQGGVTPSSVWRLSNLQMNAVEALGYPTQKTEKLLTRIITASSRPGDLVADFFCGSGTTLAVAEKLGRRWIGCDLGGPAIQTSRERLLGLSKSQSFDLLELGDETC
jgi:adenine-specific DNA-methyltransferase